MSGVESRYVIHLPIVADDLTDAVNLALILGRSLRHLPRFDTAGTTVTESGDQRVHHRVFCDHLLGAGWHCPLRAGHPGHHTPPTVMRGPIGYVSPESA